MPIDHDRLFKELLATFFVDFLDLFLPAVRRSLDPTSVVFLDKEVFTDVTAGERHVADLVAKARLRGQESFFLIHVETQARRESRFCARMFRYFARLHEKHALPVYPVAVFSYASPQAREPDCYRVAFPDLEVLRFRFRAIQLGRLRWRAFLDRPNPVAAALMARMRIAPHERPRVKAECLRLLATLRLDRARSRLISGFVDRYLQLTAREDKLFRAHLRVRPSEEREKAMWVGSQWYVTSWERKGRAEGRREMARELVSRLLQRRLGAAPAHMEGRIRRLSLKRVEALSDALFDFTDWTDVQAWLRPPPRLRVPARRAPAKRSTSRRGK